MKSNKPKRTLAERASAYVVEPTPTQMPKPTVEEELPRAAKRIADALNPEKIILFGSYAYGKPMYDSDVDLLVIWDTAAPRKERHLAVAQFLRPRVFALDLLVRTPEEIKHGLERGDFFLREIVTQGKVLYERCE